MADGQVQITLPPNQNIGVIGLANSAAAQQIDVAIDGKSVATIAGQGNNNYLLGNKTFNSGSGKCTVTMSSYGKPLATVGAQVVLGNRLNSVVIGAEDHSDMDFFDGICIMTWPLG